MNNPFNAIRLLMRSVATVAAFAATFLAALFIDGLARSYSMEGQQIAQVQPVVVAATQR